MLCSYGIPPEQSDAQVIPVVYRLRNKMKQFYEDSTLKVAALEDTTVFFISGGFLMIRNHLM